MLYDKTIFTAEKDAKEMLVRLQNGWGDYFGTYSPLYNITTECSSTYIEAMGKNFNTALTIGASGDQGIALVQNGAKKIYFFDINRLDVYFLELRKVALENLNRKDFLDFMIADNNGSIMDYRLYQKIANKLSLPVRAFWDIAYDIFDYNNQAMSIYFFRDVKKNSQKAKIVNNYYSNNSTYYDTQEKVKQSEWFFIESDFYSLDKNLPAGINFNAIVLSNLYEYLNFGEKVSKEETLKYLNFIKQVLLPRLSQDGAMMSAYLYRYNDEVDKYIEHKLQENPDGWAPSTDLLSGLENIEAYLSGYTGQNVSYHYLYQALEKEYGIQKVLTPAAGFGQSFAQNDLAIIQRKIYTKREK